MLAEKTLTQLTIEMRLVDRADKLEQLLSDEEMISLERLQISEVNDSATSQRWLANFSGCIRCRRCISGTTRTVLNVIEETNDVKFGT